MTDWYLEPIRKAYVPKKVGREKYKTDSRRLKFCESCKKVWEWVHVSAACFRYNDFPTIGLKREDCRYCKKKECK
jgi:hypothetical protein